jgi:tRNA dimethylallyltransferase
VVLTRHLALVGCTASGKSAIGLELARRLGDVEVVTVDSMQVYRGMDIGTAKPTPADRAEIPHHLLDLADPGEEWSLARWAAHARRAVAEIESRHHRALLVGGTGLYFQALVDRLCLPGRYPAVQRQLEGEADTTALYRRLEAVDPLAASRMEPANRRRVIRALEVTLGSARPFSSFGPGVAGFPATRWRIAGVWLPRAVVARRIEDRLAGMFRAGLVDEVATLRASGRGLSRTARQALGYREVLAHLEDGVSLETAKIEIVRRTRAFARRQRVWWRRDPRVRWYGTVDNPLAVIAPLLGEWTRP